MWKNRSEMQESPDKMGRLVESAVGAHLLNFAKQENFDVFYWRENNDEVDFVVRYRGKVLGIEVKSGALRSTAGIEAFHKKFNPHKILIVGATGLPWQEFLRINPASVF